MYQLYYAVGGRRGIYRVSNISGFSIMAKLIAGLLGENDIGRGGGSFVVILSYLN